MRSLQDDASAGVGDCHLLAAALAGRILFLLHERAPSNHGALLSKNFQAGCREAQSQHLDWPTPFINTCSFAVWALDEARITSICTALRTLLRAWATPHQAAECEKRGGQDAAGAEHERLHRMAHLASLVRHTHSFVTKHGVPVPGTLFSGGLAALTDAILHVFGEAPASASAELTIMSSGVMVRGGGEGSVSFVSQDHLRGNIPKLNIKNATASHAAPCACADLVGAIIAGTGDAQQQTELVSRCVKLGLPWSAAGKPAPSSVLFVVATAAAAVQAAASLPSADAAGRCLTHAASAAAAMGRAVALADAFWAALLDRAAAEREGRPIALSVLPELERAGRTMPAAICLLHRAAPALVRHAKDAGAEMKRGGGLGWRVAEWLQGG